MIAADAPTRNFNTAEMQLTLQKMMQDNVGALRSEAKIAAALDMIGHLTDELGDTPPGDGNRFDMRRIDWFDLRNMLLVSRVVAKSALARTETRGAHQREDYPRYVAGLGAQSDRGAAGRPHRTIGPPPRNREGNIVSENATLKIWRGLDANAGRWETLRGAV